MANSFNVNAEDLAFILRQIKVSEAETIAVQGGATAQAALLAIIGPNAAILPMGLRHVDGSNNNLLPGGESIGAADTVLPRLADPSYVSGTGPAAPFNGLTNTNYATPGSVVDTAPRTISNLIVDQSVGNPAAVEAWFNNPLALDAFAEAHSGMTPIRPGETPVGNQLVVTDADLSLIQN